MNTDKDCYRPLFSVPSTSSLSSLLHLTNRKSDSWYPQYFEACVFVMQLLLCNAIICSEIYTRILNNSLKKICLFGH